MNVKKHYDDHLGNFYSWMVPDFDLAVDQFYQLLVTHGIKSDTSATAVDLGAGHGIQTVALSKAGYHVIAVDFNRQLLLELEERTKGLAVDIVEEDLRDVRRIVNGKDVEVIVCCGDTIAHLRNMMEIQVLISEMFRALIPGGRAVLSFRDYSTPVAEDARFIPVKSDENRILTCVLDYHVDSVRVTDLLYERQGSTWVQKVSSYTKVRTRAVDVEEILAAVGFRVVYNGVNNRMITLVVEKPR